MTDFNWTASTRLSSPGGDGDAAAAASRRWSVWNPVDVGVPVLVVDTGRGRRRRRLHVVLADPSTGFPRWQQAVDHLTEYRSAAPGLHTLRQSSDHDRLAALRFHDHREATRSAGLYVLLLLLLLYVLTYNNTSSLLAMYSINQMNNAFAFVTSAPVTSGRVLDLQSGGGSTLGLGYFAPRSTQPPIPPWSVNEYQLRLGRQRHGYGSFRWWMKCRVCR